MEKGMSGIKNQPSPEMEKFLQIRYVKLHFTFEDCVLYLLHRFCELPDDSACCHGGNVERFRHVAVPFSEIQESANLFLPD